MSSPLQSLFGQMDTRRRTAIIAVGVVVTVLILGVSRWATAPTFVPLYNDVPLESVGTITDKLTEAGIEFRLERAGSAVLVPASDVAKARVALAREALPGTGRPGLELFDKPTWGMTDFTQKVNYRRALEGELERNIGAMRDVERVQVHLALEDEKLFKKDTRKSKASVTLAMKGGESPSASTVRGIASLVAGSVGGLEANHVVVVDERGNALTSIDDASGFGLSNRQLEVQREVEQYLERKAEALVSQMVGTGNARVQVAASINFDRIERTTQSVDPDQQVVSIEHKAEILPQEGQAGAASSNVSTTFETTRSVESFSGAIGNVRRMTVAVLVADKVTITPSSSAEAEPQITPRSAEELARIEALVISALGVDSSRGDGVSVVSAPFDLPFAGPIEEEVVPTPDMMSRLMDNPKPVITIAAMFFLLVLALVMLKALRPPPPPAQVHAELAAPSSAAMLANPQVESEANVSDTENTLADVRQQIVLPPQATTPEREQAIATVEQRPDAAVRVMRSWLRG